MAETDVLYSIKSSRARGNTNASSRRSGVTWERVALLVLSVLLAAALTALGVTLYENAQTKKLQEECEAKHLSGILSKTEACKVEQPSKPPSLKNETCPRCEDGWEPHGGKCYFFSSVKSSWNESRTQCTSMSGDLVVINNREEQEFLQSRVMEKMEAADDKFWIGLTDSQNEDEWLWVDDTQLDIWLLLRKHIFCHQRQYEGFHGSGSVFHSLKFWRHREPDNQKGENPDGEDCVTMGEEYLMSWVDRSCKSTLKSICEKPEEACG